MGINSAKSWFAVDRSGKPFFFTDYINVKKRYVEVTGILVTIKTFKMFF